MQLHRIDVPVGQQNGATSVSPQSPRTNITTGPQISMSGKIAIGYGLLGVRTTFQTVTQEVRAGGNEELATDLENAGRALAFVTATVATKGLNLIPEAFTEISAAVARNRNLARQNREMQYDRSLLGARVNFNQGRAYE